MQYDALSNKTAAYVEKLFTLHNKPYLCYHNLKHTHQVVAAVKEIAAHYALSEEQQFILNAAAWFHDTGQLFTDMAHHEEDGRERMLRFFASEQIDPAVINSIGNCILATKWPTAPQNLLEEIMCDADTYHFGTPYFRITDDLVKQEIQLRSQLHLSLLQWHTKALIMLKIHHFFTSYCQQLLNEGKAVNITYLTERIGEEEKEEKQA